MHWPALSPKNFLPDSWGDFVRPKQRRQIQRDRTKRHEDRDREDREDEEKTDEAPVPKAKAAKARVVKPWVFGHSFHENMKALCFCGNLW